MTTMIKSQYKTKQREELVAFLQSVPGHHFTVQDVCEHFRSIEQPIGTTTVYRHLERMVSEGLVSKYTIAGNNSACFEYTGNQSASAAPSCFHCKCEQCGKLIHMHCDELAAISGHLMEHHSFLLDPKRTVFYGVCEECRQAETTSQEDS